MEGGRDGWMDVTTTKTYSHRRMDGWMHSCMYGWMDVTKKNIFVVASCCKWFVRGARCTVLISCADMNARTHERTHAHTHTHTHTHTQTHTTLGARRKAEAPDECATVAEIRNRLRQICARAQVRVCVRERCLYVRLLALMLAIYKCARTLARSHMYRGRGRSRLHTQASASHQARRAVHGVVSCPPAPPHSTASKQIF